MRPSGAFGPLQDRVGGLPMGAKRGTWGPQEAPTMPHGSWEGLGLADGAQEGPAIAHGRAWGPRMGGSPQEHHPRFQHFITKVQVFKHFTRMRYFNGDSEKGLWLYSNRRDIDQLDTYAPKGPMRKQRAVVVTHVGQNGKRRAHASGVL